MDRSYVYQISNADPNDTLNNKFEYSKDKTQEPWLPETSEA